MTSDELALALEAKRPEMLRIARSFLRRHGLDGEAEDFIQDTTIKILLGVEDGRYTVEEGGVGGLLVHILLDLMRDRIRSDQRHVELTDEYTRIYQPDSQAHIQQRERLNLDVAVALDKLEPQTQQVVRLSWMEENTNRQVQKALKMAPNTIVDRLAEAKPILQHELARYDHRQRSASRPAEDRCLTSLPPYKKEDGETDDPMPSGGNGAEIVLTETDRRYHEVPDLEAA